MDHMKASRLAAIRSAGAGYALYQAYWLARGQWFSAEWSVLQISAAAGGICLVLMGVTYARLMGFRSWRKVATFVIAAEVGGIAGIVVALFVAPLFVGPFIAGWAALAWASVGLLAVRPGSPRWASWAAACTVGICGTAVSWLAFTQRLIADFDYETYGLTLAILHPMLIFAAIACYRVTQCFRGFVSCALEAGDGSSSTITRAG